MYQRFKIAKQLNYDESSKQKIDQYSGSKVWQSAYDLCEYLETLDWTSIRTVLELGCGHGLPGLVALQRGKHVTFQDYDPATLEITRQTLEWRFSRKCSIRRIFLVKKFTQ